MTYPEDNPDKAAAPDRSFAGFACGFGDSPLAGYTVQRALGRGGFGEVYYALSDAGREVALKMIQGCEQIELRGVSQCMNLKSPHLVTIFDVRYNDAGRPFVIMEYVSGPSLRDLIDQVGARGLGPQKTAYFLREIAKGLTYLHDCGIVHRDLKPANVFYEDGYVKIGDYGLSKAIQPGVHSGQTVTVGTVHYMAPEIGNGHYDSSIDIYALGAVLYEMLTGRPPYQGESLGEVLMKHLSASLDVSEIPEPFASTIAKAMAKDPADRYATVAEMVESVFDEQHVRNSVSLFSPNTLSVVASRAAANVRRSSSATVRLESRAQAPQPGASSISPAAESTQRQRSLRIGPVTIHATDRGRKSLHWNRDWPDAPRSAPHAIDPVGPHQRVFLTALAVGGISVVFSLLAASEFIHPSMRPGVGDMFAYLAGLSATGILGIVLGRALLKIPDEGPWIYRIGHGGMASLAMAGTVILLGLGDALAGLLISSVAAVCLALMLLVNWRRLEDPKRKERFLLRPALIAGLGAMLFAVMFEGQWAFALGLAIAVVSGVQLILPMGRTGRKPEDLSDSLAQRLAQSGLTETGGEVSPYYRWNCFLLAMLWFCGLGGLQRIYVGRTYTGVLYLLTWGFAGVGQLLDVIHIVAGQFRDGYARPVVLDDIHQASQLDRAIEKARRKSNIVVPSSPRISGLSSLVDGFLTALAVLLVLASIASGLALALDVPAMLAGGLPAPGAAEQMRRAFGEELWQSAVDSLVQMSFWVLLLMAGVVMMFLRRREGVAHMARVMAGCFGLLLTAWALRGAFEQIPWPLVSAAADSGLYGAAIHEFTSGVKGPMAVLASLLLLASVILFCWAPKRRETRP
jgi:serine/threonine protein kinase